MDDLVRWLGEQLDVDKACAEAATWCEEAGVWHAEPSPYDTRGKNERWYVEDAMEEGVITHVDPKASDDEGVARHIAEWDPARVLREIDAKRQLLDDYTVTARMRDEAAARIKAAGDHPDAKDLEMWDRAQREAAILEGPVKLAALPLDDRPGYREEWRP